MSESDDDLFVSKKGSDNNSEDEDPEKSSKCNSSQSSSKSVTSQKNSEKTDSANKTIDDDSEPNNCRPVEEINEDSFEDTILLFKKWDVPEEILQIVKGLLNKIQ